MPSLQVVGLSAASIAVVLGAIGYPFVLKNVLQAANYGGDLIPRGNGDCIVVPELEGCEKIVLLADRWLYLACSPLESRTAWTPALERLSFDLVSPTPDYIAVLDTATVLSRPKFWHMQMKNLPSDWKGYHAHGMDVVASTVPGEEDVAWVYAVNHRPPEPAADADKVGADSVVEIFKTRMGSSVLEHVRTVRDKRVVTPNDLVGRPDGKGFWVSNDHSVKVGLFRALQVWLRLTSIGITYCHIDQGCRFAVEGLPAINGLARAPPGSRVGGQDIFYAAGYGVEGRMFVLEKQSDESLVLVDTIGIGGSIDNLMVAPDGTVYAAVLPKVLHFVGAMVQNPRANISPSSVTKVSINTGHDAYFGRKYKVEEVFMDNGTVISGATTGTWDSTQGRLYLSGLVTKGMVACKL